MNLWQYPVFIGEKVCQVLADDCMSGGGGGTMPDWVYITIYVVGLALGLYAIIEDLKK
jgi:hypothetical protein